MKGRSANLRKRILMIGISAALLLTASLFFFMPRLSFWEESTGPQVRDQEEEIGRRLLAFSERKNIYDRNYKGMAVSFMLTSIYARPLEIDKPEEIAATLAGPLNLDEREMVTALKSERSFVWLGRKVAPAVTDKIVDLNLKGIHHIDEVQRFYPNHETAAHVVGFMKDEQGLAGIEAYYDNVLRGGGLHDPALTSASIPLRLAAGKSGAHLILTLDLRIQSLLERELKTLLKKTDAESGVAAVMAPETGEILALAVLPSYDPNRFWRYSAEQRKNRFITDAVYPGGLNNLFRFAAVSGLNTRRRQEVRVGDIGELIEQMDTTASGEEEITEGRWRLIQDGIYISPELALHYEQPSDERIYRDFVDLLGFNRPSKFDLPAATGDRSIAAPGEWAKYDPGDYASSTSALHLLTGFSRLVNGGRSISPHLIKQVWDAKEQRGLTAWYGSSAPAVNPDVSQEFLGVLAARSRAGAKKSVFLESLVDAAIVKAAHGVEEVSEPSASEGLKRFQAVMLGVAPGKSSGITMVAVLNNAEIDLQGDSPLKGMGQKVFARAKRLATSKPEKSPKLFLEASAEESYGKWKKLQSTMSSGPALSPTEHHEKMPDVRGHSLRKALQELQEYGLRVNVVGSGKVVKQHPGPGGALRGVEECTIELRMDQ